MKDRLRSDPKADPTTGAELGMSEAEDKENGAA